MLTVAYFAVHDGKQKHQNNLSRKAVATILFVSGIKKMLVKHTDYFWISTLQETCSISSYFNQLVYQERLGMLLVELSLKTYHTVPYGVMTFVENMLSGKILLRVQGITRNRLYLKYYKISGQDLIIDFLTTAAQVF